MTLRRDETNLRSVGRGRGNVNERRGRRYASGVRPLAWCSIFARRSRKYAVRSSADVTLPREHEPVEHPPPVPHEEQPPDPAPQSGSPQPCEGSSFATGPWERSRSRTGQPNRAASSSNSEV